MVTGITGQDGSYLAELLLDKGYTVYGLVRRVSQPTSGRSLINHLLTNENFNLVNGDLADQNSIDNAVAQAQPDEFYNLGAMSFVPESWRSPMMTADITGASGQGQRQSAENKRHRGHHDRSETQLCGIDSGFTDCLPELLASQLSKLND